MSTHPTSSNGRFAFGVLALGLGLGLAGGAFSCSDSRNACLYAGVSYAEGDGFKSIDGCNSCTCEADNTVVCTNRACIDGGAVVDAAREAREGGGGETSADGTTPDGAEEEAAPGTCSLETSYRFYDDGGLRAFYDDSRLAPARTHTLTRKTTQGAISAECAYDVPCSPGTALDLGTIQKAIAHPDVQEALAKAQRPTYGNDNRAADGTVWVFERSDGRGFILGSGNVPAGVRALETVFRRLTTETRAAPQCAQLRP